MDEEETAMMKVTVTFGQTGVVVPCKEGWTVRDLIQQATQRYRKLLEQVTSPRCEMHLSFYRSPGLHKTQDGLDFVQPEWPETQNIVTLELNLNRGSKHDVT